MNIYIFGNGNLSFSDFKKYYEIPLMPFFADANVSFLLCDFRGVDTLAMELLKSITAQVTIFHLGERPRYLPDKYHTKVSAWKLLGGFASDLDRDNAAIDACTHFLAIDFNSSPQRKSGTSQNIETCIARGRQQIML
jgi:hypothetical protein